DDNFWKLDPSTAIGKYYRSRAVQKRLTFVLSNAHLVIASTPLLAEYVRRYNQQVVQLDAAHNFSAVPSLPATEEMKETVRFGFAASAYRGVDLDPLLPEILKLLDANPR